MKVSAMASYAQACPSSLLLRSSKKPAPIGLLAGAGRFGLVNRFYWAGVAKLGRMIRCFRRECVEHVVMAGKIHKASFMHRPWRVFTLMPDLRMMQFWYGRLCRDKRDDSILLGLIEEFAQDGIYFRSALDLCPELLVRPGILTRRKPTKDEEADILFGWDLAKDMGRLDVGQSVAVKERAVLAVEAIEGTDRAIARAGDLCPAGGFVVVKVAKPQQDMRFDVPTIGCHTIEAVRRASGRVLAIEAGKTIIIDEPRTVALADRYGISIVAR
jgi:UDP-2,3-diacylglucosamine hydrolase